MEKVTEVPKAQTHKFILTTPDRLRDIANELERSQRQQAIKGETSYVLLTDTIVLAYDTSITQERL